MSSRVNTINKEPKKRIDLSTLKPKDPDPDTVYEVINGVRYRVGFKTKQSTTVNK